MYCRTLLFAALLTCSCAFRGHPGRYYGMHLSEQRTPPEEMKQVDWNDNTYFRKRQPSNNYETVFSSLLRAAVNEQQARKRRFPIERKPIREDAFYDRVFLSNHFL
uniref:Uncharacterized protein n=1 Tax=Plectus sambesii TaxID=2011161 RepID=A0A914UKU7_9BILA